MDLFGEISQKRRQPRWRLREWKGVADDLCQEPDATGISSSPKCAFLFPSERSPQGQRASFPANAQVELRTEVKIQPWPQNDKRVLDTPDVLPDAAYIGQFPVGSQGVNEPSPRDAELHLVVMGKGDHFR